MLIITASKNKHKKIFFNEKLIEKIEVQSSN